MSLDKAGLSATMLMSNIGPTSSLCLVSAVISVSAQGPHQLERAGGGRVRLRRAPGH